VSLPCTAANVWAILFYAKTQKVQSGKALRLHTLHLCMKPKLFKTLLYKKGAAKFFKILLLLLQTI
jgi:hypothetical protein